MVGIFCHFLCENLLKRLQMVQFECPRCRKPCTSFTLLLYRKVEDQMITLGWCLIHFWRANSSHYSVLVHSFSLWEKRYVNCKLGTVNWGKVNYCSHLVLLSWHPEWALHLISSLLMLADPQLIATQFNAICILSCNEGLSRLTFRHSKVSRPTTLSDRAFLYLCRSFLNSKILRVHSLLISERVYSSIHKYLSWMKWRTTFIKSARITLWALSTVYLQSYVHLKLNGERHSSTLASPPSNEKGRDVRC